MHMHLNGVGLVSIVPITARPPPAAVQKPDVAAPEVAPKDGNKLPLFEPPLIVTTASVISSPRLHHRDLSPAQRPAYDARYMSLPRASLPSSTTCQRLRTNRGYARIVRALLPRDSVAELPVRFGVDLRFLAPGQIALVELLRRARFRVRCVRAIRHRVLPLTREPESPR